jgi:hypothetical protein
MAEVKQKLEIEKLDNGQTIIKLDGNEITGVRRVTFDMQYDGDNSVVIHAESEITLFPSIVNLQGIGSMLKAELLCTSCSNSEFVTMENGLCQK